MDENNECYGISQPNIMPSSSKQNINIQVSEDNIALSSDDLKHKHKHGPVDASLSQDHVNKDDLAIAELTNQLKERLHTNNGSLINGIVNGISPSVSLETCQVDKIKSNSISHCQCLKNESSSHCSECENDGSAVKITDSNISRSSDQSQDDRKDVKTEEKEKKEEICTEPSKEDITYVSYESELQMPDIMRLIQKDLSEPYSIYTYRYFIHNWPKLCFLAMDGNDCIGAIVCKLDVHRNVVKRGYIAMLAVDEKYRKRKIGSNLVLKAIRAMVADEADEVVLETEITNRPALRLYENLGFVRDKRLFRYYLNGVDALRLKLWLR